MGEKRSRSVAGALREFLQLRKANLIRLRPYVVVVVVLLLLGGVYRIAMARIRPMMTRRIELPVPLSTFPVEIGLWTGEDRPLTPEVEQVAGNDDYLSRVYTNGVTGESARIYVAYSARPRTMLGHQPDVCYVGGGWAHDETRPDEVRLADGQVIPCLIHRFHKDEWSTVVLNYYVLNGVTTNDEGRFAGVGWRRPNIASDPAWYVAQVQVSGASEATVRKLATITAPLVLRHLPDREGKVVVAEDALPSTPTQTPSQESR